MSNKTEANWWIEKYPFLMVKDNSVYPWIPIGSTEEHWLSDLPNGWVNAFGEQMCDELLDALGKHVNDFIIMQTKEKYGSICLYWRWNNREYTENELCEINHLHSKVRDIITKYEEVSYKTCARCGQPATKYSSPWVLPLCDDCFEDFK